MNMNELDKVVYPETFYDFSIKGISLSKEQINTYVQECILSVRKKIEKFPKRDEWSHFMSIGNFMVTVFAYANKDKDLGLLFFVSVTENYKKEVIYGVK